MATEVINYTPPPTLREFIKDHRKGELFYDWVVGPVGSGKTTAIFFKLIRMAMLQEPSPDGIRRSRAVIVRNTNPQLKDTTLTSWNYWFKDGEAGQWKATENRFILRFGDVECDVLFRPLDTPQDIARVLSLEVTFAILDEFVQIPRQIVDALSARLGRYPSAKDGGATNWGMWGASNPDTEDNWWYEFLHYQLPENATYFKQPSGFSDAAENIENLPGGRGYYVNQAKGKSEAWIKQFLDAEWGFSAAGQPVIGTFNPEIHVARRPLIYDPASALVVGLDPGLTGSAMIIGQQDLHGRLNVLGELVQSGYGAERLVTDRLKPYLNKRFPDADVVVAPDPAAANRSQSDEKSVVDVIRRHFPVKIETNNRLAIRLTAIEHFTTRLTDVGPALLIDPDHCPILIRALKGGWRFTLDTKSDTIKSPEPDKNQYSHPGDAFGYLTRYFHRGAEREARKTHNGRKFVPPRSFASTYHHR